jgi:hypothetical protein
LGRDFDVQISPVSAHDRGAAEPDVLRITVVKSSFSAAC